MHSIGVQFLNVTKFLHIDLYNKLPSKNKSFNVSSRSFNRRRDYNIGGDNLMQRTVKGYFEDTLRQV